GSSAREVAASPAFEALLRPHRLPRLLLTARGRAALLSPERSRTQLRRLRLALRLEPAHSLDLLLPDRVRAVLAPARAIPWHSTAGPNRSAGRAGNCGGAELPDRAAG